jgi:hypothetical protein
MMEDADRLILADAAIDATKEGRRGRLRRRRRREGDRVLTHCENCGAQLTGEYCANCGQHAIDYHRSIWRVLIDAADSFLNWDTKFLSSIWVLLVRPWQLTNDFNAGRRARYVHPLRLYLLASIGFFLMLRFVNLKHDGPIVIGPQDRAEIAATLGRLTGTDTVLTPEQRATVDDVRARLTQGTGAVTEQEGDQIQEIVRSALASRMKQKLAVAERARLKSAVKKIRQIEMSPPPPTPAGSPADAAAPVVPAVSPIVPQPPDGPMIHFGNDDKRPKKPLEEWLQNRVKTKIGVNGTRAKLFLETLRNNIPTMMLCCIPLFALLLKLLYVFTRRYYVEHLVYALHIHSFAYVGVAVISLLGMAIGRWSETARSLIAVALSFALVVQVFLSIRRVYRQGWFLTALKFAVGGVAYLLILVTAVGITAFITLLLPE